MHTTFEKGALLNKIITIVVVLEAYGFVRRYSVTWVQTLLQLCVNGVSSLLTMKVVRLIDNANYYYLVI